MMIVLLVAALGALGPLGMGWIGPRGASAEDEKPIVVNDPDPSVFTVPPGEVAIPLPDLTTTEPQPILVEDPAGAFDTSTTSAAVTTAAGSATGLNAASTTAVSTTAASSLTHTVQTTTSVAETSQVETTLPPTTTTRSAVATTQVVTTAAATEPSATSVATSSTTEFRDVDQVAAASGDSGADGGGWPRVMPILAAVLLVSSSVWFVWKNGRPSHS